MSTPARAQYLQLKRQYPDALLLYRLGDFYELFDDDARIGARELDLTLTGRQFAKDERVPMAGVPHHAAESYIARLVARGYKVAVCEQVSDPRDSKGIVDREIVRVVTPGTVTETTQIEPSRNNFLAAIVIQGTQAGFAYVDVTTGEFTTCQLRGEPIATLVEREIARVGPAECLWPAPHRPRTPVPGADATPPISPPHCFMSPYEARAFAVAQAAALLRAQYHLITLDGQPWGGLPLAIAAAGALLAYVRENQRSLAPQIRPLTLYASESFMSLDAITRRNLELTRTIGGESTEGSLVWVVDRTKTAPGGRLLRRWLAEPLLKTAPLARRHDAVGVLVGVVQPRLAIVEALSGMGDLERLTGRILQGTATPRELRALHETLGRVEGLKAAANHLLANSDPSLTTIEIAEEEARLALPLGQLVTWLDSCPDVRTTIDACLVDDPPAILADGGVIRPGFSNDLDGIHAATRDAREWVAALENRERERTGIRTLKVGYNKVFGYYIEISHANAAAAPSNYIRKQTLVGAERYITPELKKRETLILSAQERIVKLEAQLLSELRVQVAAHSARLLRTAQAIAQCDVYTSFATVAAQNHYCRPEILDRAEGVLEIEGGRHPVVELTQRDVAFVPNDVRLDRETQQIIVLTGPNMAGKSTWLRQTALCVLLAQVGCFVPAQRAQLSLVDRIFTRVGAQDDISTGRSTFMVEMVETAIILSAMTSRSLVILDEVGRGTSTYDGVAIAQAVVEHLHNNGRARPNTVFATHYHELTALAETLPRVRNFRMDVLEEGDAIVFLRRVVPGGADKSYGIHVAELAGLPPAVVKRARHILRELEDEASASAHHAGDGRRKRNSHVPPLSLFDLPSMSAPEMSVTETINTADRSDGLREPDALLVEVAGIDAINMTPLQALQVLFDIQQRAQKALKS